MVKKKSFTAPFWIIGILFLLFLIVLVGTLISFIQAGRSGSISDYAHQMFEAAFIRNGLISSVLLIQCILYWRFRHWIVRKGLAWGSVISTILALFIVPICFMLLIYVVPAEIFLDENKDRWKTFSLVRNGMVWGLMVVAQVYFIMAIIVAVKARRNGLQQPTSDSKDILSEYTA